jgi:hypothetical protein
MPVLNGSTGTSQVRWRILELLGVMGLRVGCRGIPSPPAIVLVTLSSFLLLGNMHAWYGHTMSMSVHTPYKPLAHGCLWSLGCDILLVACDWETDMERKFSWARGNSEVVDT